MQPKRERLKMTRYCMVYPVLLTATAQVLLHFGHTSVPAFSHSGADVFPAGCR